MSLGPVMLDVREPELAADEREMLQHPLVGGVILFARNYHDPEQLTQLTEQIHALREPRLLLAVDHEGGRVQRFRQGFTPIPAAAVFGKLYQQDQHQALHLCNETGWLLATELLTAGIDFSFTPVLDLDYGASSVIGDRSFHKQPDAVSALARSLMQGMRDAGMIAVGKHFPGHGYIAADSHHETPVDKRCYEDILMQDLVPFERLINAGLPAIMPAHVIYSQVDDKPAGFSRHWLQEVLRRQLGFDGTVFSDDISMAGAEVAGDHIQRADAALEAGCDMILICNDQPAAITVLEQLQYEIDPLTQVRLMRLHGKLRQQSYPQLTADARRQQIVRQLAQLDINPELELGDDQINT
ncbi:MAG: beta-N-acetylhexosaminidase [Gammaproteobacteria bacterium]